MNRPLQTWTFIASQMQQGQAVMLLYVVESIGSSPGRQGFFMAVSDDGKMQGSIGGGIMEHKLVEFSREQLTSDEAYLTLKKQFHRKTAPKDQSGMICSGEQYLAIFRLTNKDLAIIEKLISYLNAASLCTLTISLQGIDVSEGRSGDTGFIMRSESDWEYRQIAGWQNTLHIIGGGHCALALSRYMSIAGFRVIVYDDRKNLHTVAMNSYAQTIIELDDYTTLSRLIPEQDEHQFIVIMTFGYRTDAIAMRELMFRKSTYLGLLGSRNKIAEMMSAFRDEGIDEEILERVYAPAGIPINSREPEEIAISIAAEIISVKNSRFKTNPL